MTEMDAASQIEELIVEGSQGLFDDPHCRMILHVTLDIATEFREFLVSHENMLPADDVTYVMDTIRSGMDELFSLAYYCRFVETDSTSWSFNRQLQWNGSDLRRAFLDRFEDLSRSGASAVERLAALLALGQLELVFLARNFPLVVIGDGEGRL